MAEVLREDVDKEEIVRIKAIYMQRTKELEQLRESKPKIIEDFKKTYLGDREVLERLFSVEKWILLLQNEQRLMDLLLMPLEIRQKACQSLINKIGGENKPDCSESCKYMNTNICSSETCHKDAKSS